MTTRIYGSKYDGNLSTTDITKKIREDLKAEIKSNPLFAGAKFSVRKDHYHSISISIKAIGFNPINPEWIDRRQKEPHGNYPSGTDCRYTADGKTFYNRVESIAAAYNHDGSDIYSDYFDVNFYLNVSFDYQLSEAHYTEIETDLENKLAEYNAKVLEAMPVCDQCGEKTEKRDTHEGKQLCWNCYYPHYKREQDRKNEQAKIEQARHQKQLAPLHNLIARPFEKEMICKVALPKLNKNCTLDEYREQLTDTERFDIVTGRITDIVSMTAAEYDLFCENLLESFPWLTGKGGGGSTADLRDVESFHQYTKEEREIYREHSYTLFVLVAAPDRDIIAIDPSGHDYARYVGFPIMPKNKPEKPKAKIYSLSEYREKRNGNSVH
jgi:hypothetical protein